MKIERLEELQQNINALRSLNPEEGAALVGEIWRLRTAQTGKELEVSYLKDGHDRLKAELDRMSEANRVLQAENDQLKSALGLPKCDLENRWSNCAVRMRKRRELDNSGKHVNGNYTGPRSLADTLFKTSTKHKTHLSR
jgi:regulator of replication initiation timing